MMTALIVGCAALHVAPTRSVIKRAVARRAAVPVMDEEVEAYLMPFANVTAAAANIKEMLRTDAEATAPLRAQTII